MKDNLVQLPTRLALQKGRIIGIRHRVKFTADGEARPTQAAIFTLEMKESKGKDKGKKPPQVVLSRPVLINLETEQDELDFLKGKYPVAYRPLTEGEDASTFPARHVRERKQTGADVKVTQVPETYEGLQAGDTVAMILGGSGDRFAAALSRRGDMIGAKVVRITPFNFKAERVSAEKEDDACLLAQLYFAKADLFTVMLSRDVQVVWVRECYRAVIEAMKARIACEQRIFQAMNGRVFCTADLSEDSLLELDFDQQKANDGVLQALVTEEKIRRKTLERGLQASGLGVYDEMLKVKGLGPMISARLIAAIIDIRRFATKAKLKAFCGVHVMPDGTFPRRKRGSVANWHNDARQALYLIAEQFNKTPDGEWGQKLRLYKVQLRAKHPEPVEVEISGGRKITRYTNGHIHRMACWRTATKFVEWLFKTWWACERKLVVSASPDRVAI